MRTLGESSGEKQKRREEEEEEEKELKQLASHVADLNNLWAA